MAQHSPKQRRTVPAMTTLKSFALLLFLVASAHAQTSVLPEAHVKLTFAEPRAVYKVGEPIKLIMEFTADREGYIAEVLPDRNEQGNDTVIISPEIGVTHWVDEMTAGQRYLRDVVSTKNLSNVPQRVELILNDTLRFDIPGRYTVSIRTRRVTKNSALYSRQLPLTTNSVTFELEPMSYADEAAEVKRKSACQAEAPGTPKHCVCCDRHLCEEATRTALTMRWSESGSCRIAHLVDSLMSFAHPPGLQSMSRLASPFHSR